MMRVHVAPVFVAALALAVAACSKAETEATSLPSLADVSSAPAVIQKSARAVVRVRVAGSVATGSFISSSGLLLTNNHVLGVDVCPIEGCYVQLTFLHQRGEPPPQAETVFVLPVAVDVGLDMALVQVLHGPGMDKFGSPDFLEWSARDAASLVGSHVHIVGHPEGHLKKWTSGLVVDSFGEWFETSAFILPGSSGSPVLGDDGRLVGIIHRAPTGEDLVSSSGYVVDSIGTASAPLMAAVQAPLPPTMISTAARATRADVLAHDRVYLNAHAHQVSVETGAVAVLDVLGAACDEGLARASYRSPEDLTSALLPCSDAMAWIECRVDASPVAYGVECPKDVAAWAGRFQAMNASLRKLNGEMMLDPVSFGVASLAATKSEGVSVGGASLSDALSTANAPLDFGIANYLAAFQITRYGGTDLATYVKGYARTPHYELFGTSIASTALWLNAALYLPPADTRAILAQLAGDRSTTIATKLYVEDVRYRSNIL